MRLKSATFVFAAAASIAAAVPATHLAATTPQRTHQPAPGTRSESDLLKHFTWRSVGPAGAGGRVVAVAVAGRAPQTIYAGVATGGVWKSTNEGTSWQPVFDH